MTDNEKLARWQGWSRTNGGNWINPFTKMTCFEHPDYLNYDAAAMSLLDTLVDKEYGVRMFYDDITPDIENKWVVEVLIDKSYWGIAATRREAVVAAVLDLIAKGA